MATIKEKLWWFNIVLDESPHFTKFDYTDTVGPTSVTRDEVNGWIDYYIDDGYTSVKERVYVLNSINSIYKNYFHKQYPIPKDFNIF